MYMISMLILGEGIADFFDKHQGGQKIEILMSFWVGF